MSQKVVVLSPLHNLGTSAATALMAHCLAQEGKSTMLCYTSLKSPIPDYFGIEDIDDPMRSIMQVTRLIDAGVLKDKDILTYSHQYANRAYLLNMSDPSIDEHSADQIIKHVYSRVPVDLVFCDVSENLDEPRAVNMLQTADAVFIAINPTEKCYSYVRDWLSSDILKDRGDVFILLNNYSEIIDSVRNIAKHIGIPAVRVCKIHYNPWIAKCTAVGQLQTMAPLIQAYDPRVANLNQDMKDITQCIGSTIFEALKVKESKNQKTKKS